MEQFTQPVEGQPDGQKACLPPPGRPAGYPPFPAAGACKSQPIPEIPSITVQTYALAAGDTAVTL